MNFKVGQRRLCKRTWEKYTVKKVNEDGSVEVLYDCPCHGFPYVGRNKRLVKFDKPNLEDRVYD